LRTIRGYLVAEVAVFFVRLAVFVLVALAVALAIVPILVIIDLLGGGTGWGMCPAGIELCHRPYSAGAELIIVLTLGLFVTVLGIRLLMRLARRLQDDTYQVTQ